ncbi:ribosome hibernation-promoting factor, HPF/YfiA family [Chloroflexota bacterium]
MKLHITGTNIQVTPEVQIFIEHKFNKLSRYLSSVIESKVEISEEKTKSPQQHYLVRVTIAGKGVVFHGEERGDELFLAINKVVSIMSRQLEQHKGKLLNKRGNSLAKSQLNTEGERLEPKNKVIKIKRFTVKPMSVDEAIDQMELLEHDFFLFFNAVAEELNLLYRRNDGNYGVIEPELG